MTKKILFLAAFFALTAAQAQTQALPQPFARLVEVEGLVTITTGDQLINGVVGTPLLKGSRIVTTSSSAVTIEYRSSGCRIKLDPNESLVIDEDDCCAALLAIGQTAPPPVLAQTAVSPAAALAAAPPIAASFFTPTGMLTGGLAGAIGIGAVVNAKRNKDKLSGS